MRFGKIAATITLLLSSTAPAASQVQNSQPAAAARNGTDSGAADQSKIDEAVAFFLLDALTARSRMRDAGLETKASRLWGSAAEFAGIVRSEGHDAEPKFLPVLDDFRRTLAETVPDAQHIDGDGLTGIQMALDDQIEIYSAPGAFSGGHDMVAVTVNARRGAQAVNGLYVWLDLVGAVPKGRSANPLTNVTSPASGIVGPGRYLVRLMQGDHEVGRRDMPIGRTGLTESIDVVVN
jgi:hypothetical protein